MSQSNKPTAVYAVNFLSMLPGVDPAEFEQFSNTVDRPRCLAHTDLVQGFDAFRVVDQPEGSTVDIVEVMRVADWPRWEQVRDNDPSIRPVMDGFNRLVDPSSVRTLFTVPIIGADQS